MAYLIPIQYHFCRYSEDIQPKITEVAGHFDISKLKASGEYSLHTEYSFMGRKFESTIIKKYRSICEANKRGIPMLWYSEEWAIEFADFLKELTQGHLAPKIIEIHPSFSDYSDIGRFVDIFNIFENRIKTCFPDVTLLVENRSGTRYSGGDFILSNIDQLVELSNVLEQRHVNLRITIDLPQLFTTHQISSSKVNLMEKLFEGIKSIRHNISGIHLWGKRESENGRRVAHIGDLNSYFMGDMRFKGQFLELMFDAFDDDVHRYFVPEVNSGSDDLVSIVKDLK